MVGPSTPVGALIHLAAAPLDLPVNLTLWVVNDLAREANMVIDSMERTAVVFIASAWET